MGSLNKRPVNEMIGSINRSPNVTSAGLCSRCSTECKGGCRNFLTSFRGTEVLYPQGFGKSTIGSDKEWPVDYSHLQIQGNLLGKNPGTYETIDTTVRYSGVTQKVPITVGALGSTQIAATIWEGLVSGVTAAGLSMVAGENIGSCDPKATFANGKLVNSPEMDRRIKLYQRYHIGWGEMRVQVNADDYRLGIAEYVQRKFDWDSIEIKLGQGFKSIPGEVRLTDPKFAQEMKNRGFHVTSTMERHGSMGEVSADLLGRKVDYLRELGFARIGLKTGAYSLRDLAFVLRFAKDYKIDTVTVDAAGGGSGMSPAAMGSEYGVPGIYLHSKAIEYCKHLNMSTNLIVSGGIGDELTAAKALAMGDGWVRQVGMARALVIPCHVGLSIDRWMKEGTLPHSVARFGTTKEEIFTHWDEVQHLPTGGAALYSLVKAYQTGLQQIVQGLRKKSSTELSRDDLFTLTREAEEVTGIPFVMDAQEEEAYKILDGV